MGNKNLKKAKNAKNDEFYTQISDIEKELVHYKDHFRDKVIFCNCDDPQESNFWKYFMLNFDFFGLKKLISTHYHDEKSTYKLEYDGIDIIKTDLRGNGDFRSPEAVEILKESDIIATNPPFSIFRDYVAQLIEYDKKFLIVGNMNAITYKEVFPLLKENKVWLGNKTGSFEFEVPMSLDRKNTYIKDNKKYAKFGNITWFTNLEHKKRNEKIILYKEYTPEEYPKYDNYDAINVDKVKDIPDDYYKPIGVPISFMDKYNPEQFEIIDSNKYRVSDDVPHKEHGLIKDKEASIGERICYVRVLIKRKE